MTHLWVNGQCSRLIDAADRGLSYGDGLFETLLIQDASPRLYDAHKARMLAGAACLGLPESSIELAFDELQTLLLPQCEQGPCVAKITVTRGVGGRGYLATATEPTRVLMLSGVADWSNRLRVSQEGANLRVCDMRLGRNPALAGMKHLNRLEQVMARSEWDDPAIHEGIVLDVEGKVVECTMSNIFWVSDDQLYTPDLTQSGVNGVVKTFLMEAFGENLCSPKQGYFDINAVLNADEVFICNSINGVWPVTSIASKAYPIGHYTRLAQRLLSEEYAR